MLEKQWFIFYLETGDIPFSFKFMKLLLNYNPISDGAVTSGNNILTTCTELLIPQSLISMRYLNMNIKIVAIGLGSK